MITSDQCLTVARFCFDSVFSSVPTELKDCQVLYFPQLQRFQQFELLIDYVFDSKNPMQYEQYIPQLVEYYLMNLKRFTTLSKVDEFIAAHPDTSAKSLTDNELCRKIVTETLKMKHELEPAVPLALRLLSRLFGEEDEVILLSTFCLGDPVYFATRMAEMAGASENCYVLTFALQLFCHLMTTDKSDVEQIVKRPLALELIQPRFQIPFLHLHIDAPTLSRMREAAKHVKISKVLQKAITAQVSECYKLSSQDQLVLELPNFLPQLTENNFDQFQSKKDIVTQILRKNVSKVDSVDLCNSINLELEYHQIEQELINYSSQISQFNMQTYKQANQFQCASLYLQAFGYSNLVSEGQAYQLSIKSIKRFSDQYYIDQVRLVSLITSNPMICITKTGCDHPLLTMVAVYCSIFNGYSSLNKFYEKLYAYLCHPTQQMKWIFLQHFSFYVFKTSARNQFEQLLYVALKKILLENYGELDDDYSICRKIALYQLDGVFDEQYKTLTQKLWNIESLKILEDDQLDMSIFSALCLASQRNNRENYIEFLKLLKKARDQQSLFVDNVFLVNVLLKYAILSNISSKIIQEVYQFLFNKSIDNCTLEQLALDQCIKANFEKNSVLNLSYVLNKYGGTNSIETILSKHGKQLSKLKPQRILEEFYTMEFE